MYRISVRFVFANCLRPYSGRTHGAYRCEEQRTHPHTIYDKYDGFRDPGRSACGSFSLNEINCAQTMSNGPSPKFARASLLPNNISNRAAKAHVEMKSGEREA